MRNSTNTDAAVPGNADFWNGRRVLLTGHTGFKGSWLSAWLLQLGSELSGLALEPETEPSMFRLLDLDKRMDSHIGDIRDPAVVKRVFESARPEVVIHMAAQSLVRRSYGDPVDTFMTNVMGTVHVLEAARQRDDIAGVLVVTSDKCYENNEWPWGYRECDAMGGHDPYSASKGCAELVTASYRRSYEAKLPLASARAGNVIGGGDWSEDRLIPDIVRAVEAGTPVNIRNPDAIRPWQHVLEPLSGYLQLTERLASAPAEYAGAWNFGPATGDTQPVSTVVDSVTDRLGFPGHWRIDDADHPHEAHYLKLDISKAVGELGYRPRLALDDALEWTAEWYRAFFDGEDMLAVTNNQIDRFRQHCTAKDTLQSGDEKAGAA